MRRRCLSLLFSIVCGSALVLAGSVTAVALAHPDVSRDSLASALGVPTVSSPTVTTPTVTAPTVSTPTVTTPTVTTPSVTTPTVTTPTVKTPTVTTPPTISTPPLKTPTVSTPSASVPPTSVAAPTTTAPRAQTKARLGKDALTAGGSTETAAPSSRSDSSSPAIGAGSDGTPTGSASALNIRSASSRLVSGESEAKARFVVIGSRRLRFVVLHVRLRRPTLLRISFIGPTPSCSTAVTFLRRVHAGRNQFRLNSHPHAHQLAPGMYQIRAVNAPTRQALAPDAWVLRAAVQINRGGTIRPRRLSQASDACAQDGRASVAIANLAPFTLSPTASTDTGVMRRAGQEPIARNPARRRPHAFSAGPIPAIHNANGNSRLGQLLLLVLLLMAGTTALWRGSPFHDRRRAAADRHRR